MSSTFMPFSAIRELKLLANYGIYYPWPGREIFPRRWLAQDHAAALHLKDHHKRHISRFEISTGSFIMPITLHSITIDAQILTTHQQGDSSELQAAMPLDGRPCRRLGRGRRC